jgi:hypothetical protein
MVNRFCFRNPGVAVLRCKNPSVGHRVFSGLKVKKLLLKNKKSGGFVKQGKRKRINELRAASHEL